MYLSKLELLGFKSFAQKTKLKFTDGISCVIGPNGSGKSNIVDAIRWVLGEQKVSILRTDRMDSVIFNGSKDRRPLSMAEVSLTVHNNKEVLASEYSDVVISRRLYRSGESQYFINKSPSRLKDIQNLFMDTGMGANSYSVIELAMVESIISENPGERRHLFEEAAGVTKYKTRRKSALRKLDLTQQDMSRIDDIISEITRNVNSLSRQVGKARRYLKYQDELKKLELDLARYRYGHYMDEIEPLRKSLEEISMIKEDASQQITLEEAILEEYKRELIQSEQKISEFNHLLREQDEKIHKIKEEEVIAHTRAQSLEDNIKRNSKDIDDYNDKIEVLTGKLGEKKEIFKTDAKDIHALKSRYDQQEKNAKKLISELNSQKETLDSLNNKYREQLNKVSAQKEITQQNQYQLSWNSEQIQIYESEKEVLTGDKTKLNNQLKKIVKIKNEKTEKRESLEQKHIHIEENRQDIHQKVSDIEDQIKKYSNQNESLVNQLAFYKDIIASYQGHLESTRELMTNRNNYEGLHGPISEIVKIDEKYASALEVALGESANYLIVDTVSNAQKIISEVENKKLGRVTIIPLDRIKKLDIGQNIFTDGAKSLAAYVSCKSEFESIIRLLIGDVILVEKLKNAISQSEKNTGWRYVTINGEMITSQQAISGGHRRDPKSSLIGRKEHVDKIKATINDLHKKLEKSQEEKKKLISEEESVTKDIDEIRNEIEILDNTIKENEKNETTITVQKESIEESISKIENEKKQTFTLISRLEEESINSEKMLMEYEQHLNSLESEISELNIEYSKEEISVQEKADVVKNLNIELINASNNHKNLETEINRFHTDIAELHRFCEKRKQEIEEMEKEISQIDENSDKRKKNQSLIWEEHDRIEKEKEKIEKDYHEVKDKIINLENQIKKYRKQHDTSVERTRHLELDIKENEMKSAAIKDRIREDYNEDITVGIPYDGLNVEESEQHIESFKFKIKQMGQVNPLAVSEYERESERLEFFKKQFGDLKEAEKSLLETINKINITANKQFIDTFTRIKENFERVFASFFINGEGTLQMEEASDPLEANIEILVRPKGKRMQTISLLSGGEKTLTAISLLFAIYLVKPSPFCILDEIDAPLDDVNIGRFTQALQDFSEGTQFIVVTHNKRTMESADTLYGVTMEEEGLSKLVSVKFN